VVVSAPVAAALTSVAADDVTHLLAQLAVILVAAWLAGRAARWIRQPAVIGYVLAGVVLGPGVLGRVWPQAGHQLFPAGATSTAMLLGLAGLGAVLLLALTGMEIDLRAVMKWGRVLPGVTLGSLLLPLAVGYGLGWILPASFIGDETSRAGFALLVAIAFGISSPPVMAAVLGDLGLSRRGFAHVAMSVAMSNDVVGWVLLGLVVAGAGGAASVGDALGRAVLGLVILAVAAVVAVQAGRRFGERVPSGSRAVVALGFVAALAAVSNGFGIEAVLGAFVAGLALRAAGDHWSEVTTALRPIVHSFLGPVFFVVAGIRVNIADLSGADTLLWTALAVVSAALAKIVGVAVPARIAGRSRSESLALGAILNVRGSLEIVLAGVALTAGLVTGTAYSVIIVVALGTSMLASPLLRFALRDEARIEPSAPEGVRQSMAEVRQA
jgi:Kef-type K+ transport system membrane component KefB